ncbi:hypothetical protein G9A89_009292 [Geosiphon pyriformis]|nr:hypothetical protein G9A89_009292 [Geosiphon pyriformis]
MRHGNIINTSNEINVIWKNMSLWNKKHIFFNAFFSFAQALIPKESFFEEREYSILPKKSKNINLLIQLMNHS